MNELTEILRGMADMLDGPQNAGNLVVPSIIRRFREAADTIERLETENTALRKQLTEKEIELQAIRNAANQFKQRFAHVTAERDAAIQTVFKYVRCRECKHYDDSSDPWWCLKHDRQAYPGDGCSTPEWRGLKEDGGNDKL